MTAEDPIVAFLRARLDEDDEVAQATRKNEQFVHGTDRWFASHSNAITSMAPHRAVAEVEAKRRIMATYTKLDAHPNRLSYAFIQQQWVALRAVIAVLALPYADHDDYDPAWSTE